MSQNRKRHARKWMTLTNQDVRGQEMKKITRVILMKGREELENKTPDRRNDEMGFT